MDRKSESPRYVLILGGLFLVAYAAYQVGSAWMAAQPLPSSAVTLTQTVRAPDANLDPVDLQPAVTATDSPLQPITTDSSADPYPQPETSPTLPQSAEDAQNTNTPLAPYPGAEINPTPAEATPTGMPTNTEVAPEPAPGTPTVTQLPSATPGEGAYPGPEQTATANPGDPYPAPEKTQELKPTSTGVPIQNTPTPSAIPQQLTATMMLTPTALPTLENIPEPIKRLPFREMQILTDGVVNQVVWMDDGTELVMATSDGLYLLESYGVEPVVLDAGSPIASVAINGDNQWLAAGGQDSLIRIWDWRDGSFQGYASGHLMGVVRLSYAPSADFLVSASDDATVRIWSNSGAPWQTLRGPTSRVVDMAVSANGILIAATSNQFVHIWNPLTGEQQAVFNQTTGWYRAAEFSPNVQRLVTAYDGRRLEFWDTVTWERLNFLTIDGPVQDLVYSPNGRMLAVGYQDGRIQIWDSSYYYLIADLAGHSEFTSMDFSPNGEILVTSSADGSIRLWELDLLLEH